MDYEKLYKESLERAKQFHKKELFAECNGRLVEYIFPELKESEEERIRKELVAFLEELSKLGKDTNFDRWKTSDCANWIAWLEKQGQTFTKKDVDDAYLTGVYDAKQELEKQGEQKVSYTTTVETGDGGINALVTKDIEIPFGAKDSELQEVSYYIPKGYYAYIDDDKVIIKKRGKLPTPEPTNELWEQRRYELAKAALIGLSGKAIPIEVAAVEAVRYADAVIKELRHET